ncbi:hypothetical protein BESB_005040 [Besnoitia besnoiti]|uniref:Transporter n=1 Tax=Besnoitia besnoiti TaxID=94643 RepID=A0A2A9MPX0_BESBE|nr:hypothetical protein BESB_005040 [Besnoitia besnoiti]PFH38163.1 hypothetical protein BESB_005040 [Besnoitia besnoiti]
MESVSSKFGSKASSRVSKQGDLTVPTETKTRESPYGEADHGGPAEDNDSRRRDGGRASHEPATAPIRLFERLFERKCRTLHSTPAMAAARLQPTPFGINRFVLLGVYIVYALLTGRVYFAWPNISNMLFRSGAYLWLCGDLGDASSIDLRLPENGGRRFACEHQNTEVQNLFVVCLSCAFACSLLAGFLLDKFGPKLTGLFGQTFNFTAWILLGLAGRGMPTYYPSFVLMGIGADSGYMATLSVANLFPGHEGVVVALLGSAKSLSFAVPTILDTVESKNSAISVKDTCFGYAALGPGLCWLICLLLIEFYPFLPWASFVHLDEAEERLRRRQEGRSWSHIIRSSSVSSLFSLRKGSSRVDSSDILAQQVDSADARGSSVVEQAVTAAPPEPLPSLPQQLLSKFCFLMVFHVVIQALAYPFLSTSAEGLFGKDVNNFLGVGMPFSCISCIIYGKLTDMYGITKVLLGLNTIITAVFGLALVQTRATAYIAAVLLIFYVGFYSSQVYCYVSDTFASAQFGRIVGAIFMIGGFCSLLKIPLQSMVVHVFHSKYTWPVVMMIGLCFVDYGVLGLLFYYKKKSPHPFWPTEAIADAEQRKERKFQYSREQRRRKRGVSGESEAELAAKTTLVPSSDHGWRLETEPVDVCVAISFGEDSHESVEGQPAAVAQGNESQGK